MNYTIYSHNSASRLLQIDYRFKTNSSISLISFYNKNPLFTSRLTSITAHDSKGKELELNRSSPYEWTLVSTNKCNVCISYIIHAFFMDPKETYSSGDTWIINPQSCFMHAKDINDPCDLIFILPDENFKISSNKDYIDDIEGKIFNFENYNKMLEYPIMIGLNTITLISDKLYITTHIKGLLSDNEKEQIQNTINNIEQWILETDISISIPVTILLYIVPKEIETKGLNYGISSYESSTLIISPSENKQLQNDLIESIIKHTLPYNYDDNMLFFREGFNRLKYMKYYKTILSTEDYRLKLEKSYIRTFCLKQEINENILDSSISNLTRNSNLLTTYPIDKGFVICQMIDILLSRKNENILHHLHHLNSKDNLNISTINNIFKENIDWFWNLAIHSKQNDGFLSICKSLILDLNYNLEQPKKGPVKLLIC